MPGGTTALDLVEGITEWAAGEVLKAFREVQQPNRAQDALHSVRRGLRFRASHHIMARYVSRGDGLLDPSTGTPQQRARVLRDGPKG